MTLTIEDGSGVVGADSYVDATDASAYLADHYTTTQLATWTAASSGDKEIHLRNAAQYLSTYYGGRWIGTRANETQGLDWPRTAAADQDGYAIDDDAIPQAIIDAQCELALRAAGAALTSDVSTSVAEIASESKSVGSISKSVTYVGSKPTQTRYTVVDRLVSPFVYSGTELGRA